jgi:hypothetical protein
VRSLVKTRQSSSASSHRRSAQRALLRERPFVRRARPLERGADADALERLLTAADVAERTRSPSAPGRPGSGTPCQSLCGVTR